MMRVTCALLFVALLSCHAATTPGRAAAPATAPATRAAAATNRPTTTTDAIVVAGRKVEFTLVRVPAGKVTLRDKAGRETTHDVKPIWIGRTEVTWDEYDVFWLALDLPERERGAVRSDVTANGVQRERPATPYSNPDRGWGHAGFPAGSVPFYWADAYCKWLSKHTGRKYRLPTEAEWEYACRAGGAPAAPNGKDLDRVAWHAENAEQQTHAVARKAPNAWGLYDTLGNVAEWVTRGEGREPAVAGGSFGDEREGVHGSARAVYHRRWQRDSDMNPPSTSWYASGAHIGFRVVRED